MTIDFEKDQQDAMKKTGNIQSLADQVESLENVVATIETAEENLKDLKKKKQTRFLILQYQRLCER